MKDEANKIETGHAEISGRPYGRVAKLYSGRRVRMEQVHLLNGAVIGQQYHKEHWTVIFCLAGQLEVRILAPGMDVPYHGHVVTTASDPLVIRHGIAYEIVGLMDSSVIILHGTYEDKQQMEGEVVKEGPDLTPGEYLAIRRGEFENADPTG